MRKMTSRERILAALSHCQPDRVPFSWGFGLTPEMGKIFESNLASKGIDWDCLRHATDDKVYIGPDYIGHKLLKDNFITSIWGIRLKNIDYGGGVYQEFTDFPLAGVDDPRVFKDYPWPDPDVYDYKSLGKKLANTNPRQKRAVQYFCGNPFEIYCWMTGLEEALVNLLLNPKIVTSALDHITSFFEDKLRKTLQQCGNMIDIIFFADDLGSQNGLLISRQAYREILQPFHRRLTNTVKELAPQAQRMLHSDGAVFDILPDILDAGFQILEAVQIDAQGMAPENLKKTYGDRLSFHGAISVQQLLPNSDAKTVERECRRLVNVLGDGG